MDNTFTCQCHTECLVVTDVDEFGVDVSFWRYGNTPSNWRYRLRHIWQIIRTGTPYTDFVSLDRSTARELGKHLQQVTDE